MIISVEDISLSHFVIESGNKRFIVIPYSSLNSFLLLIQRSTQASSVNVINAKDFPIKINQEI